MSSLHILELPSEVLSLILLQVPCADLVTNVGLVCRHFHALLRSAWYWRTRFVDLTSSQLPNVPLDSSQWKLGCLQYESMAAEQKMHSLTGERLCPCVCVCVHQVRSLCVCVCLASGSVGSLDCVHMLHPSLHGMEAVIAAGSRDSIVYLWRQRSSDRDARSMRSFTSQSLNGHKVRHLSLSSHGIADYQCAVLL